MRGTDVSVCLKVNEIVIDTVVIANAASWFATTDRNNGTLMLYAPAGGLTVSAYAHRIPNLPLLTEESFGYTAGAHSVDNSSVQLSQFEVSPSYTGAICEMNGSTLEIDVNGNHDIPLATAVSGYSKLHIFVQSYASEYVNFFVGWKVCSAAFDESGNAFSLPGGYRLPTDDPQVFELVYDSSDIASVNELNVMFSGSSALLKILGYYIEPLPVKGRLLYPMSFTSGTQTATADGVAISCNGWTDYNFSGITYSAENKLHVFVKNTSQVPLRVLMGWAQPDECYNQAGQSVNTNNVDYIAANGETYELVFSTPHELQFNLYSTATATLVVEGYYVGDEYAFVGEFKRFNTLNEGDRTGNANTWNTTSFAPITKTKETHVFVKNRVNCPSAPHKSIFQMNWTPADEIKQVTGTNGTTEISGGTTLLDPDWNTYELIYNAQESGDWNEFNISWASDANEIEVYGYYQVETQAEKPATVGKTLSDGTLANTRVDIQLTEQPLPYQFGSTIILGTADKSGLKINYKADGKVVYTLCENGTDVGTFGIAADAPSQYPYCLSVTTEICDADADGNNDDLRYGIWFNEGLSNNRYYYVIDGAAAVSNALTLENVSTESVAPEGEDLETLPEDFTVITPFDMGIANGVFNAANPCFDTAYADEAVKGFDKTILNAVVKFESDNNLDTGFANIYYGGKKGETTMDYRSGLLFQYNPWNPDHLELMPASGRNREGAPVVAFDSQTAKVQLKDNAFDLKISTEWVDYDGDAAQDDLKIGVWFNGILYNNEYIYYTDFNDDTGFVGEGMIVSMNADSTAVLTLTSPINNDSDVTHSTESVYYSLENGPYLLTGNGIKVNGVSKTAGDTIDVPGDYEIVRTKNGVNYTQNVYLYRLGDVHADGSVNVQDIVAVKKLLAGNAIALKSGLKAADVDKDGTVSAADAVLLKRVVLGLETLDTTLPFKNVTFSDEAASVMPIAGFYGPYASFTTKDPDGNSYVTNSLLTDDIYEALSKAGINLIVSSQQRYDLNTPAVETMLQKGQAYGIDYFISDGGLYNNNLSYYTKDNIANRISLYSHYSSFKGIYMDDEPIVGGVYPVNYTLPNKGIWDDLANKGNSAGYHMMRLSNILKDYTNISTYMNLLPYEPAFGTASDYADYVRYYIDESNSGFVSVDKYCFWNAQDNVTTSHAQRYLKTLDIVSAVAKEKDVPFWSCVQAGSNFNDANEWLGTTSNFLTEAQMKWNVNTSLAFGAKGIEYFPLVQQVSSMFSAPGVFDYTRNGLVGGNGNLTAFYNYAAKINSFIAAVDDVLMESTFEGIIASDGTWRTPYVRTTLNSAGVSYGSDYKKVSSIETGNQNTVTRCYGALAGCFDYYGKTAVYVVNYDVNAARTVTVNLNATSDARVIAPSGTSEYLGTNSVSVNLGAGEAALVVVD
ncbi:MAG: dockerin type I repeat-containing protein [Clostridia bacterium]|nr:dockerin type I repeat-containing protein [Clostridia bacterium]